MDLNVSKGSFIVISDFHSNRWPLDEKIPQYLNEYDVVYILGDATDRGNDQNGNVMNGEGGVQLLIDIMNLSRNYPGRVIYIPGNHDEFLYDYAAYPGTNISNYMGNFLNNPGVHGSATFNEINELRNNNPFLVTSLMDWMAKLPLQRVHEYDGQRYSLAHAFFNQTIYNENPNFSLDDLFWKSFKEGFDNKYRKIVEFRNGMGYDVNDVPVDSTVVIGHTPIQFRDGQSLDLNNSKGTTTKVVCVDGGIAYQTKSDEMLKFTSGFEGPITTVKSLHQPESTITNKQLFDRALLGSLENYSNPDEFYSFLIQNVANDINLSRMETLRLIVGPNSIIDCFSDKSLSHGVELKKPLENLYGKHNHGTELLSDFLSTISNGKINYKNMDADALNKLYADLIFDEKLYSMLKNYVDSLDSKSVFYGVGNNDSELSGQDYNSEVEKIQNSHFSDEDKARIIAELEREFSSGDSAGFGTKTRK